MLTLLTFGIVLDGTSYRLIDNTELDLWMNTDRNANGTWDPKQITIDARFFKNVTIRCMAAYYSGTVPTSPASRSIPRQLQQLRYNCLLQPVPR